MRDFSTSISGTEYFPGELLLPVDQFLCYRREPSSLFSRPIKADDSLQTVHPGWPALWQDQI